MKLSRTVSACFVGIFGAALIASACTDTKRKSGEGESCLTTDDCGVPLRCTNNVCRSPNGTGGATSSSTGDTSTDTTTSSATTSSTSAATTTSTTTSTGSELDPEKCAMCLDMTCSAELAACDADCHSVEACLEAVCSTLDAAASSDEGTCQVHCQQAFPAGKQHHLDVVNCANATKCQPCSSYPFDYDACRGKADGGACATAKKACTDSVDCSTYVNCIDGCTTYASCLACANGASGMAGYNLDLDYERCIANECIAESWLPVVFMP